MHHLHSIHPQQLSSYSHHLHPSRPMLPSSQHLKNAQLADFAAQMVCYLWFGHVTPQHVSPQSPTRRHSSLTALEPKPLFVKFCADVIATTQISYSVVLLSLLYIYRLKCANPYIHGLDGSEYRLFTVAVMLANKFLDDNTYTNKTWSEVTSIAVREINIMEREFLTTLKFTVYVSEHQHLAWLKTLERLVSERNTCLGNQAHAAAAAAAAAITPRLPSPARPTSAASPLQALASPESLPSPPTPASISPVIVPSSTPMHSIGPMPSIGSWAPKPYPLESSLSSFDPMPTSSRKRSAHDAFDVNAFEQVKRLHRDPNTQAAILADSSRRTAAAARSVTPIPTTYIQPTYHQSAPSTPVFQPAVSVGYPTYNVSPPARLSFRVSVSPVRSSIVPSQQRLPSPSSNALPSTQRNTLPSTQRLVATPHGAYVHVGQSMVYGNPSSHSAASTLLAPWSAALDGSAGVRPTDPVNLYFYRMAAGKRLENQLMQAANNPFANVQTATPPQLPWQAYSHPLPPLQPQDYPRLM